ncbi:MAG: NAD-dependent epimerase/dehydratase family protein [Candidatus Hydrogenedentes bacterium]|nr:NAD-dependent epimerase/dehydratase family protein [Candidatus Hydrogenedentota bacterium]
MKVLIIGGTRFLGAAIARELAAQGHGATVLHRGRTQADLPEPVDEIIADARERAQVEPHIREGGFDAVVDTILRAEDLAWYLPLVRACCGRMVHCGSTGVYAPMANLPARETDPTPCPPEFGGFGAKLAQDRAVLEFHERTEFPVCSLRISNVFGAGDVPLDLWGARNPACFQRIADGAEIWVPNDGRALLQPVHVQDLARGFCSALESDTMAGQIYNLSSDQAVTLAEYARLAKELLGSDSPVRCVPMGEILATGKANEGGLRFVCEHMCIDSSKARRDLGYAPRFSVRAGLRDSLEWMVARGSLAATVGP